MYIFCYSTEPLPDCLTLPFMYEADDYDELVDQIQDLVFGWSFKQLLCSKIEQMLKINTDVLEIIWEAVAENPIEEKLLITMQLLLYCLETARKSRSVEALAACIEGFNEAFALGNPTGWSLGAKLVMDDAELSDFLAGDMGPYEQLREKAQQALDASCS